MKTLETRFTHDGFNFKQLKRIGDIALYEKSKEHYQHPSYEVIRIRVVKEATLKGETYPEHEAMPRSESWGTHGWTYTDLVMANKRFETLTAFDL